MTKEEYIQAQKEYNKGQHSLTWMLMQADYYVHQLEKEVEEERNKNKKTIELLEDIRTTIKDFNIIQRKETGAFWWRIMGSIDEILGEDK